jgi:probable phosphoglycerate mutase
VLVRHGESRATVDGIVGGPRGCQGLTDLGRSQAEALGRRLLATGELSPVGAVLASTLPRAVETARIVARHLGSEIELDEGLCELDPGEGDGLTWDEWQRRYEGFDVAVEPFRRVSPGGESWASFGLRAGTTLHRLAERFRGTTVVAVCHGGIIEQSMLNGLHLPAQFPPALRLQTAPNTSLTEWVVDVVPGQAQHWRLVRFADAAHLSGPW